MAINPFAQPINYSAQFVDLTPAFRAAGEGFRAIGEGIQEREKQEQAMTLKAQYATDLQNALNNPTQATWSQMIAKYPQQREAFAEARKGFGETALANEFNQGFEVSTALENKRPEVAKERLQTFITARKNSNLPTGIYEDALEALERNDVLGAQANVNSALAMADPDRFQKQVEARLKASTAPSVISEAASKAEQAKTEAQTKVADLRIKLQNEPVEAERLIIKRDLERAEADKAKVDAEFARTNAVLEQEKKRADITKTESDILIAKEDNRIKALNATIARETNALRRQELQQKIDDATEKRDSAKREQQATLATAQADVDNFVNTATQVINTPIEIIRQATGPDASRLPTLSQPVADFESLVETLGSQIFIAQIPKIKGAGALSEKEGDKLQASVQNLSLKQSPDQLKANVTEAVRLLEKARNNLALRAGLPSTPRDVPAEGLTVRLPNGSTATFPTKAAADAYKKAAGIQ